MESRCAPEKVWAKLRSLDEALLCLRAELTSLGHCADDLQEVIGAVSVVAEASVLRRLQAVDRLTQRLDALAGFVDGLRGAVPGEWRLGEGWCAAGAVCRERKRPEECGAVGECELF